METIFMQLSFTEKTTPFDDIFAVGTVTEKN